MARNNFDDNLELGCIGATGCMAIGYILFWMALVAAVIFLIVQIALGNVF